MKIGLIVLIPTRVMRSTRTAGVGIRRRVAVEKEKNQCLWAELARRRWVGEDSATRNIVFSAASYSRRKIFDTEMYFLKAPQTCSLKASRLGCRVFLPRALQPGIDGCEPQREVSVFRSPLGASGTRQGGKTKPKTKQTKEGEKVSLRLEELSGWMDERTQLCGSRLPPHHCLPVARRSERCRPTTENNATQRNATPSSLDRQSFFPITSWFCNEVGLMQFSGFSRSIDSCYNTQCKKY